MGYTHYWDCKNPVVELAQLMDKRVEISRNCNSWEEMESEIKKLPTDESLVKKIAGQVEAFKKIKSDLENVLPKLQKDKEFKICGPDGTGDPVINDSLISFNGEAETRNDFETFSFKIFRTSPYWKINEMENSTVKDFCKTSRNPYDIAVCVSLMVIKHHLGSDFNIKSDGDLEDGWDEAIQYYENHFKRKAPKQLISYLNKKTQDV